MYWGENISTKKTTLLLLILSLFIIAMASVSASDVSDINDNPDYISVNEDLAISDLAEDNSVSSSADSDSAAISSQKSDDSKLKSSDSDSSADLEDEGLSEEDEPGSDVTLKEKIIPSL